MKYLIAGLGNVGNEYAHTRHNIGFDVVMAFVTKHGGQFKQDRLAYASELRWKGRSFICICPTTFMNLSGKAIKYWMDKEKIDLENILVIVDDLALPLSKIRIRPGGSDAGHNGLKASRKHLEPLIIRNCALVLAIIIQKEPRLILCWVNGQKKRSRL